MNSDIPADLTLIKVFIQRGNELKEYEPVVAYYCFFYAVQQAVAVKNRSKEANAYLFKLMDELELLKKSLSAAGNECISNEDVAYSYVENFALKIFLKADTDDRNGHGTKKTAMMFLASSVFLQVLKVFSSHADSFSELDEKIKYAKWKAADIAKALREGRVPTAGPPGETADEDSTNDQSSSHDVAPSLPPVAAAPPVVRQPPAAVHVAAPVASSTSLLSVSAASSSHDPLVIDQASKCARFAISALQYDDIKTALENLEKALLLLKPYDRRQH